MNRIVLRSDGKYGAWVNIQDGNECVGTFDTERQARNEWVKGQKAYNNDVCKPGDVGLYAERYMTTKELVCIKPPRRRK